MSIANHISGLQHIGIPTNDLEATVRFFESLGFTVALRSRIERSGDPVCFLKLHNLCIETYENHQAAGKPGAIDHIALEVGDIEAAYQAVRDAGHLPLEDQIQFLPFWERGVRYFNILGPNQEKVEFSQTL